MDLQRGDEDVALALEDRTRRANEQERALRRRAQAEHRETETAKWLKADIVGAEQTRLEKKAAVAALTRHLRDQARDEDIHA